MRNMSPADGSISQKSRNALGGPKLKKPLKSSVMTITATRTSSASYEKHESGQWLYKSKISQHPGRARAQEAIKIECHDYSSYADLLCFPREALVWLTAL
ncbi:hypothetical protein ACFXTI_003690 [Malus domestica]